MPRMVFHALRAIFVYSVLLVNRVLALLSRPIHVTNPINASKQEPVCATAALAHVHIPRNLLELAAMMVLHALKTTFALQELVLELQLLVSATTLALLMEFAAKVFRFLNNTH